MGQRRGRGVPEPPRLSEPAPPYWDELAEPARRVPRASLERRAGYARLTVQLRGAPEGLSERTRRLVAAFPDGTVVIDVRNRQWAAMAGELLEALRAELEGREVREVAEAVLGGTVAEVTPTAGGYSAALRAVVRMRDGRSAFVKRATDELTTSWLRIERRVYDALSHEPFMPGMLGWYEAEQPALVLEDLSPARRVPPWSAADVSAVLRSLSDVHAAAAPEGVPAAAELRGELALWRQIAAEPEAVAGLGVCSESWLGASLPGLIAAEDAAEVAGDRLLHFDVRSDNLFIRDGRAVLVDWNWAAIGDPTLDIAGWLPSLHLEGGPPPWQLLPGEPAYAVLLAGFFGWHASQLPPPGAAASVRALQLAQFRVALDWAARELALPPPA